MSHFTVLVIGNDPAAQLAPFHEYECTGEQDQYVQNIDRTQELLDEWKNGKITLVKPPAGTLIADEKLKSSTVTHPVHGTLLHRYAECLIRLSATEKDFAGKPAREWFLPEGYEEIEVVNEEVYSWRDFVMHEAFDGETIPTMKDKDVLAIENFQYPKDMMWGFAVEDDDGNIVKVYRRTNPNAKWDWYQAGGRWSGMLKVKEGRDGQLGNPGVFGNKAREGYADSVRVGDIDFAGMRADAEAEAAIDYDRKFAVIERCTGLEDYTSWDQMRALYMPHNDKGEIDIEGKVLPVRTGGIQAARDAYHAQEFMVSLAEVKQKVIEESKAAGIGYDWVHWFEHENYLKSREQFIREAGLRAGLTYAIVKDYQWYQRGEMGWFGMSSGEVSESEWLEQFGKLIDGLPEDTLLTVVDCHI